MAYPFEEIFFYDTIDIYNQGNIEEAKSRVKSKLAEGKNVNLSLLLDKFSQADNAIYKANEHAKQAMLYLQSNEFSKATKEIESALIIQQTSGLLGIQKQIILEEERAAREKKQIQLDYEKQQKVKDTIRQAEAKEIAAQNRIDEGIVCIEKGQTIQGLKILKDTIAHMPNEGKHVELYKAECNKFMSLLLPEVEILIRYKKYEEAEKQLLRAEPHANGNNEFNLILKSIKQRKEKATNRKTLIISIISVFLLGCLGVAAWAILNEQSERKKIEMGKIADTERWKILNSKGTIQALETYLKEYKNGMHNAEAANKLMELNQSDSMLWATFLRTNSPLALNNYISKMIEIGGGKNMIEATEILDSLDWYSVFNSEDQLVIQNYIEKHPNSKYTVIAQNQLASNVTESERNELLNYVRTFYSNYMGKDYQALLDCFNPITSQFESMSNATKGELRTHFELKLKNLSNLRIIIDESSFKAIKDDNQNYTISFYRDVYYYMTYSVATDPALNTGDNFYINSEVSIEINSTKKIVRYINKEISSTKID